MRTPFPPALRSVHPRACGGDVRWLAPAAAGYRSIPACAGEPIATTSPRLTASVHPRARGVEFTRALQGSTVRGLSPPGRGNDAHCWPTCRCSRFIPARAGWPCTDCTCSCSLTVHPRVGGRAVPIAVIARYCPNSLPGRVPRVQPRAHGPDSSQASSNVFRKGASPRLRGEIYRTAPRESVVRLHPRGCGAGLGNDCPVAYPGAPPDADAQADPHVIGTRAVIEKWVGWSPLRPGCIPGIAGWTARWSVPATSTRVHPRGCGARLFRSFRDRPLLGSSRVRRGI